VQLAPVSAVAFSIVTDQYLDINGIPLQRMAWPIGGVVGSGANADIWTRCVDVYNYGEGGSCSGDISITSQALPSTACCWAQLLGIQRSCSAVRPIHRLASAEQVLMDTNSNRCSLNLHEHSR
jgi:hypothetical protein